MAQNSFDLFDTLLGRFYYHPNSIFELVEKYFPFPAFTLFRQAAAFKSDRTLPDIYRKLQELIDITDSQATALMQFELEMELKHIFPIIENCNLVKDGDLIVTDTYYNESQIRKILGKIGIFKQVKVYASPYGKSLGNGWEYLKNTYRNICHLGDSLHSDVIAAHKCGIDAAHYKGSQLSINEKKMVKLGHSELAYLMRVLRLQNPYSPQSSEYLLWNEQCQLNIPILIHASIYLDEFCKKHKKKRVLFTSRDGCLWIQIFSMLYPHYETVYFHVSRYTYFFPTASFIEYVREIYSDNAVIVDAHGKGKSCELFFKQYFQCIPTYLAIINSGNKHHAILRTKTICEEIERINYDLVGALYDVQKGKPMRSTLEYNMRFVKPAHFCIEKCLEVLSYYRFDSYDLRVVRWMVNKMKSGLILDQFIEHARAHFHLLNENGIESTHLLNNNTLFNPEGSKLNHVLRPLPFSADREGDFH